MNTDYYNLHNLILHNILSDNTEISVGQTTPLKQIQIKMYFRTRVNQAKQLNFGCVVQ